MKAEEILESADNRIKKHRMGDVVITVKDSLGNAIADTSIEIRQTKHAFLFGCNIFQLGRYNNDEMNSKYEKEFSALLNYATLPFYWGSFER